VDFGKFAITGESRLDTFCYPEVFFRKALAIHYELPDDQISRLISLGLKKVYLLFCPEEAVKRYKGMGLEVEVVDGIQADDSSHHYRPNCYRWLDQAKGFSLGNDPISLRWTPNF
jgi:hypothetical protein